MKVLYVGHYMPGCTTRMRGEVLQNLLKPEEFRVVDIDIPVNKTPSLFRSLGWRFYVGPLIHRINSYLEECIKGESYFDLVWIDKGVFIRPDILRRLKRPDNLLVHFTPDTAFTYNRSRLFFEALPLYDYCITTKSFEMAAYRQARVRNLIYCTQAFDASLHKKLHGQANKSGVVFIGQQEPWRVEVLSRLLERGIEIKLSGADWESFSKKHKNDKNLVYLGSGLFGDEYAKQISGSLIGLGLLSKKFPEKHTTRTFEIPACGTALATERNDETASFFVEDDVLFYNDLDELLEKVEYGLAHPLWLSAVTARGEKKVMEGGYDYQSILKNLLLQILPPK